MQRPLRATILLLLAAAACTHQQVISSPHGAEFEAGDRATVTLEDGSRHRVRAAPGHVGIVWQDGQGLVIDSHRIRSIERVRTGHGAVVGLGIGVVAGIFTGVVSGLADGDDECPEQQLCWFARSAGDKAALGAIGGAFLGAIIGPIVGAIRGSTTVYQVDPDDPGLRRQEAEQARRREVLARRHEIRSRCEPTFSRWLAASPGSWARLRLRDEMSAECRELADAWLAR